MTTPANGGIVDIPVSQLRTRPDFQARTTEGSAQVIAENLRKIRDEFDPDKFDPIVVARDPDTGGYFIVGGHHRVEGVRQRIAAGKHHTDTVKGRIVEGDVRNPADLARLQELARFTNIGVAGQSPRELLRSIRPLIDGNKGQEANVSKIADEVPALGPTLRDRRRQAKVFYDLVSIPDEVWERVQDEAALSTLAVIGEAARKYGLSDETVGVLIGRYVHGSTHEGNEPFRYPNVGALRSQFIRAAERRKEIEATPAANAMFGAEYEPDPFLAADLAVVAEAKSETAAVKRMRAQLEACRRLSEQYPEAVNLDRLAEAEARIVSGEEANRPAAILSGMEQGAALAVAEWKAGRGPKPPWGDQILRQVAPEMYEDAPPAPKPAEKAATEPRRATKREEVAPPAPEPEPGLTEAESQAVAAARERMEAGEPATSRPKVEPPSPGAVWVESDDANEAWAGAGGHWEDRGKPEPKKPKPVPAAEVPQPAIGQMTMGVGFETGRTLPMMMTPGPGRKDPIIDVEAMQRKAERKALLDAGQMEIPGTETRPACDLSEAGKTLSREAAKSRPAPVVDDMEFQEPAGEQLSLTGREKAVARASKRRTKPKGRKRSRAWGGAPVG